MKSGRYLLAATALLLAGCGADDPQVEAASPTSAVDTSVPAASVLTKTETPTTSQAPVTGLPPVTFADGGSTTTLGRGAEDTDSRTSSSTSTTSTTIDNAGAASSTSTTNSTTTTSTTIVLDSDTITDFIDSLGIEDVDDILGLLPPTPPGAVGADPVEIALSRSTGLADNDEVTVTASNLPISSALAYAQCDAEFEIVTSIQALADGCVDFQIDFGSPTATATFTVTVRDIVFDTDCRVEQCYIGLAVLPGTAEFVAFEPISFG